VDRADSMACQSSGFRTMVDASYPRVSRAVIAARRVSTLPTEYAWVWMPHGESVKTVQARLGHANAAETLDTYSHLWPDSDDRTRAAVDSVLGNLAYSLRTAAPLARQSRRSGA